MTEVYYANLTDFVMKDISYYEDVLSKQRIDAVVKQSIIKNKKQSLVAGLLLNEVLKKHGSLEKTEDFETNPFGKRIYHGFDVNLSHSKDFVVCAWSSHSVGIDIEKIKKYDERVPVRFFTKKEQEWILQSKDSSRAFFLLWTRKESIAKWRGTGIQETFFEDILLPNDTFMQSTVVDQNKVYLHSFQIKDYLISVCSTEEEIMEIPEQILF